jgi:hypothetical protein
VPATLSAQDIIPAGLLESIFDTELFTQERGRATIFLPCDPWQAAWDDAHRAWTSRRLTGCLTPA